MMENYPSIERRIFEVFASSSVAVSHTGNTNETTLATIPIPAGYIGINGLVRVATLWSHPGGSGNNKIVRGRLGGLAGTLFFSATNTTNLSVNDVERTIGNRNSAASQVVRQPSSGLGNSGAAVLTMTVNTALAQDLVFTAQLASAGESITLEQYIVEIARRS